MKKNKAFFSLLAMLLLILAISVPVHAEDHSDVPYYITAYNVNIYVTEENELEIYEEIDVYFNEERHGIYRTIPQENNVVRVDGSTAVTHALISNIDCSEEYEEYEENGDLVLQIGDPDFTVSGDMHYSISYDYYLGQDAANGYDELYYNIIGTQWDTYIDNVTFTVTMPKEFDEDKLGFSTGSYGFSGTYILDYYVDGLQISGYLTEELAPYEGLTIRLELEEGYFYFDQFAHMLKLSSMVIIPAVCLLFVFIIWLKFGKDRKVIAPVEFYPPAGMTSADCAYWYKGRLSKKDMIGMLIELANEGFIAIHDRGLDGMGKESDYAIERLRDYPDDLNENKKLFFDGLFGERKRVVTSSDLKNKFYTTLQKIQNNYGYSGDVERVHSLLSTRLQLLCWAVTIACVIINFVIFNGIFGGNERIIFLVIGLGILAVSFWLSFFVTKRTDYSHKNLERLTGFRKFLETAEKDRLEALVHENPKYFYKILPYAYVLDVSDVWVKKFENIAVEPPQWYTGYEEYTTYGMWRAMNRTLDRAASAMVSIPVESSSGGGSFTGGGGGFSGGGSGGGGGGSW